MLISVQDLFELVSREIKSSTVFLTVKQFKFGSLFSQFNVFNVGLTL